MRNSALRCWAPRWPRTSRRQRKLKPEAAGDGPLARKAALDHLARREHSRHELERKLAGRGFAAEIVDETIAALRAEGLLSDARYTESFVHSRLQRGSGPQKIRAELRARGIGEELISTCLESCSGEWDELIARVRIKRFGSALPADFRERSRQMRFLQQRGFTAEQIAAVFHDPE
jgi:regulatory protein